jgi:hypothetical protein
MRVSRSFCVLSFLFATACAVGVGLDADLERFDAGPDASLRQTGGRAGGAGQAGSSVTSGQGGSFASTGSAGSGQGGTGVTGTGGTTAGASVVDASEAGGARNDGAPADAIVAVDTSNGCVSGQKVCDGRCVVPEARVGCDLLSCNPCPTPAHAIAICTGTSCDFACMSGYVRSGAACIATDGSAGAGGTGGAIGDAGPTHCVASQCGGCIPVIQAPCCKPDDTCGCQFPFFPCN